MRCPSVVSGYQCDGSEGHEGGCHLGQVMLRDFAKRVDPRDAELAALRAEVERLEGWLAILWDASRNGSDFQKVACVLTAKVFLGHERPIQADGILRRIRILNGVPGKGSGMGANPDGSTPNDQDPGPAQNAPEPK